MKFKEMGIHLVIKVLRVIPVLKCMYHIIVTDLRAIIGEYIPILLRLTLI